LGSGGWFLLVALVPGEGIFRVSWCVIFCQVSPSFFSLRFLWFSTVYVLVGLLGAFLVWFLFGSWLSVHYLLLPNDRTAFLSSLSLFFFFFFFCIGE
jgi:hypothetical protein